jgi:ParB family transcriptional regulator, chromosome partitioning protein
MTQWFNVSAENYFSRVSKASIIEALTETKIEIPPHMEKMKKSELAAIAEREIGKQTWVPKLMRGMEP